MVFLDGDAKPTIIRYHSVFPVKYSKALFNAEMMRIVDLLTLTAILIKAVDQAYHFLRGKWFGSTAI